MLIAVNTEFNHVKNTFEIFAFVLYTFVVILLLLANR